MRAIEPLAHRPRYRAATAPRPQLLLFVLLTAALCYGAGYAVGFLRDLAVPYIDKSTDTRVYAIEFAVPLFVLFLLARFAAAPAFRHGLLQSRRLLALAAAFLTAAFFLSYAGDEIRTLLAVERGELDPGETRGPYRAYFVAAQILLGFAVIFYAARESILGLVYDVAGGIRARERAWFFQPHTGADVIAALESGNARLLQISTLPLGNRAEAGTLPFTVVLLSTCPRRPDQPGYLFIKDVTAGSRPGANPSDQPAVRALWGKTHLQDVRIEPHEIDHLEQLLSAPVDAGDPFLAPGSAEDGAAGSAAEFDRIMAEDSRGAEIVGLPRNAPRHVWTPGGSSVRLLAPHHRRPFRTIVRLIYTAALVLFLAGAAGGSIGVFLNASGHAANPLVMLLMIAGWTTFAASILLFILAPFVIRPLFRTILRNSTDRLITPNRSTILVAVEDARTYNKLKILADDYALLHVIHGALLIELSRSQVQIQAQDLTLTLHEGPSTVSLRIGCTFGDHHYAIVAYDMADYVRASDPARRAAHLADRIMSALTPVAPAP